MHKLETFNIRTKNIRTYKQTKKSFFGERERKSEKSNICKFVIDNDGFLLSSLSGEIIPLEK
jgi:hypothetical protein